MSHLFPQIHGVKFGSVENLGSGNILLLLRHLKRILGDLPDAMKKTEELIAKGREDFDEMELIELCALNAYQRVKFGHFKLIESSLRSLVPLVEHKPKLPILRDKEYFAVGDDVMVYVGDPGFYRWASRQKDEHGAKLISKYHWVPAKIFDNGFYDAQGNKSDLTDTVTVFCYDKVVTPYNHLGGHLEHAFYSAPVIFKRREFFDIKKIVVENNDTEFLNSFFANCVYKNEKHKTTRLNDVELMRRIITDPLVDPASDQDLKNREQELIMTMVKEIHKLYVHDKDRYAKDAKIVAERFKVSIDDEFKKLDALND